LRRSDSKALALVVRQEEHSVSEDSTAKRAPELIVVELGRGLIRESFEVIWRVQRLVTEEFEYACVIVIGA
jgi:hypothetical protein